MPCVKHAVMSVKVKMTIVIVQKRHHTRFFPGRTGISVDRNNNVPPGTIVDTTITSPDEPQYYLVSHQAVQGVARPTQYCILLDDGNHKMDDLQALTNAVSIRADFLNLYNCFFFVCVDCAIVRVLSFIIDTYIK